MKLSSFQLETHLKKTISPLYIVSGDDLLLKQDTIDLIEKYAKNSGFSEKKRLVMDSEFNTDQLYTLLHSASLFGEKSLIEMDFRDGTPNKTIHALLEEYVKKPSPNHTLLLLFGKLDQRSEKAIWFQALEKHGLFIALWPISHQQLPQWIMKRAHLFSLTLSPKAASLLADFTEGNLVATNQALEKLALLQVKTIDEEQIRDFFNDAFISVNRFTIFDLMENLINKNSARTFSILDSLKKENTEPVLILWGIARELRILSELAFQFKKGSSLDALFQKHRIHTRRQAGIRKFLNHYPTEAIWGFLKHAAEIDRVIKGGSAGNVWDQFQLMCLRML